MCSYSEEWKQDVDVAEFWSTIKLARADFNRFATSVSGHDRKWLIRFCWQYDEFASRFGRERYHRYTNPEFSEDSQDDLWNELVGRGQEVYEKTLHHPEFIPNKIDYNDVSHDIKDTVLNQYHTRFGNEVPAIGYGY